MPSDKADADVSTNKISDFCWIKGLMIWATDGSLVLESSRLDLGSHCTLCKARTTIICELKDPLLVQCWFFCRKVIFQIFARQLAQMTRNVSCVVYLEFIIHHCSNPHFRSDFQMTQRKWVENFFVRQSHKRDWGSGKEGMDLYLVFASVPF